ncbi:hypothetical protein PR202_gb18807 [Eleusine coracana subsp. coracana]|uniref:Uncharacterized protein n=2 Tax=Eleusine coracana subsp. coracana TaxID=191504 RepID=A0AAV5F6L1_ELECO|nr:hypothetical protein PR202_gb18807 [Eleusine coracana subsp. coracana]
MLVAALMDIITSNCDNADYLSFQPLLPADADTRDIAAAIEVIEQGGMHFDDHEDNSSDDGDRGLKGIGIKVLGGTTVLGFSRGNNSLKLDTSDDDTLELSHNGGRSVVHKAALESPLVEKVSSSAVPGLWDDLQREHVAVPFATWALANWAIASDVNRTRIQELDSDGHAVATALKAPERTVKWHGALVARALLEDHKLTLPATVPDWCLSLLSTASQATENNDMPLGQLSLSTFLLSMMRCNESKFVIRQKGLHPLRSIAKKIEKQNSQNNMKESIAVALGLLYAGEVPLSLEESQRWSGILLRWLLDKSVSDKTHLTAVQILSSILEDYGPASVPISQGWLALALSEILGDNKAQNLKGTTQPEPEKVKVLNQLASAVVKLASAQSDNVSGSDDKVPLSDFLSLEPFATTLKNLNKKNPPKFDAADSASATLKGIKALAELCSEDVACQKRLADLGALSLLRHILLGDDYEKLAAIEAYDASRIREVQDKNASNVSSTDAATDPSSVRIPPAAHIRRHAGRLLTILSLLPNSKKEIVLDDVWCKWLEECASGRIPCNDIKLKSYCRLTLLNIFCSEDTRIVSDEHPDSESEYKRKCPQFGDALFLLNPELPLEIHLDNTGLGISKVPRDGCNGERCSEDSGSETGTSVDGAESAPRTAPLMDVVFVHGLRGGPFNSWRIADDKSSTTKAGLVESIDEDAGKEGTCWPREWLAADFPQARFLQSNTSMGGLVVKQLLYQAKLNNYDNFLNNTVGLVFYSCPHFGSKLADMPWRMGLVFRPAPSIGELRSGSPRLVELNDFVRQHHSKGLLDVLSFSETQVTPIVEGYGGWALRSNPHMYLFWQGGVKMLPSAKLLAHFQLNSNFALAIISEPAETTQTPSSSSPKTSRPPSEPIVGFWRAGDSTSKRHISRQRRLHAGLAHKAMVDAWWPLLGAAIPALVAGQAIRIKRRRDEEQRLKAARGREKSSDEVFVCERVCTSKRMLKKVGAFSKDPIPETCVTVCGVSELDACADACARTVCVNQHQVPNWNDVCLKRCQSECLKLSSTLM